MFKDFDESDFFLDSSDVVIGPEIGQGQFSNVFIGKYFGDYVAVKKQARDQRDLAAYLQRELAVLKNIDHQNLVAYIGAWNEVSKSELKPRFLFILTEFCQGGDLLNILSAKVELSWKFRIKMAKDIICGLQYLHFHNLIHRDIKSANILMDGNWICKITDFGMARHLDVSDMAKRKMTICGTEPYMAPELLFDEEYGAEADIYSFGMVLLELIKRTKIGENNFAVRKPIHSFRLNVDEVKAELPTDSPESMIILAFQCLEYDSADRPQSDVVCDWIGDLLENTTDDESIAPPVVPKIPEFSDNSSTTVLIPVSAPQPESVNMSTYSQLDEKDERHSAPVNNSKKFSTVGDISTMEVKTGYLHKRKRGGFKVWRKRWHVLTKTHLSWYGSEGYSILRRGRLDLRGIRVQRTVQFRFVLLRPSDPENFISDGVSVADREFSASSLEEMEDWITCIELVCGLLQPYVKDLSFLKIDVAQGGVAAVRCGSEPLSPSLSNTISSFGDVTILPSPKGRAQNITDFENRDIEIWLNELDMGLYVDSFISSGYSNLSQLLCMGLTAEDVDIIGITNALHKKILLEAACCHFSTDLKITVTDTEDYGSVNFIKVRSEYKFNKSIVLLSYPDLYTMHGMIVDHLKDSGEESLFNQLPQLPGKRRVSGFLGGRKEDNISLRRIEIQTYVSRLYSLLQQTPYVEPLLNKLEINIKDKSVFSL